MSKLRVVLYVRKSRLKEEDTMEISRQLELLIDYANNNNMEFNIETDIFKEQGSSEDWNRPEFQKMLKTLESGVYDGVLVTEQDRISRDSTDMGLFKRFCINESLMLYTLTKTYNFLNDEDNFMSGIQGEMDAHFMRITKRKLMRGRIKAVKDGIYFGLPPLGYVKPNTRPKRLIIEPYSSQAVKMIFDLYVNKGWNQTQIVEKLNLLGFKTSYNKPFTVKATSSILSNEAYLGTLKYNLKNSDNIIVENAHPALVDKETFDKAQVILAERRSVPQDSTRGTYLLSKLIKCAKCGTTLSFSYSYKSKVNREKGKKELYISNCYHSLTASKKNEIKVNPSLRCNIYGCLASYVEDLVMKDLEFYVDELSERIEELKMSGDNKFDDINGQIELINNNLSRLDKERKRVQDGYKDGIYESEEAQQLLKGIKEDKLKLERDKKELEKKDLSTEIDKLSNLKERVVDFLSSDDLGSEEGNAILRSIIKYVAYQKDSRGHKSKMILPEITVFYKV